MDVGHSSNSGFIVGVTLPFSEAFSIYGRVGFTLELMIGERHLSDYVMIIVLLGTQYNF